jgi:hypothetical protein
MWRAAEHLAATGKQSERITPPASRQFSPYGKPVSVGANAGIFRSLSAASRPLGCLIARLGADARTEQRGGR